MLQQIHMHNSYRAIEKSQKNQHNKTKSIAPLSKKNRFCFWQVFVYYSILPKIYNYLNQINYLCVMDFEIEIENRLFIGFQIGFSYYPVDDIFDYSELSIFLGLIALKFRLWK